MHGSSAPSPLPRRGRLAALALALLAALGGLLTAVPASAGVEALPGRVIRETLAPGIQFIRVVDEDTPRRIFILRIDPRKTATVDVALAGKAMPVLAKLSEIVARTGAIAGVNGDFGTVNPGRPTHPFAEDGELVQTALQNVAMFSVSRDGSKVFLGAQEFGPQIGLEVPSLGRTLKIDRWNRGGPALGEIAAFSTRGGTLEPVPGSLCATRLMPSGDPKVATQGGGAVRAYEVARSTCSQEPMKRKGGLVLTAQPGTDQAGDLLSLRPGATGRVRWTFGWQGTFDAIGGGPMLVSGGAITSEACTSSVCNAAPRTAVGVTADGIILLVVVDGRQTGWSRGLGILELAQLMLDLGCQRAMNLDGGGSTTMVVNGKVVNRPSDGFERGITSAIVIHDGADPGEASFG